ncbi:MAG: hypothetical protein LBC56_05430 [Oscillospiraceae bacterium]|jgi:hypothetical protein|nr:hypothetical protein [Oscillospiraceae bacterium]
MKKNFPLALFFALALILPLFGSCAQQPEETQKATLYAVFSHDDNSLNKTQEYEYAGDLTTEILAKGLSEWTGYDFSINGAVAAEDGSITVDWSDASTLVSGVPDAEEKEGFNFNDREILAYFMLDSLCRTVQKNLNIENVYYTMNGGQTLALPSLTVQNISSDEPYQGSGFYYSQPGTGAAIDQLMAQSLLEGLLGKKISELRSQAPEGAEVALALEGDTFINDVRSWAFALGTSLEDEYILEGNYAVMETSGEIYKMNTENKEYQPYNPDFLPEPEPTPQQPAPESQTLTQEAAFEIIKKALESKIAEKEKYISEQGFENTTTAIVADVELEVNGLHAWSFVLGTNSPEKFTAEEYYAVTDDGKVYYSDILRGGEYVPFE